MDFSSSPFFLFRGALPTAAANTPGEDMNHAPEQVADPTKGAPTPPPAPAVSQTQFSRPSIERWTPGLRQLTDSAYKEGYQWALTKHNGGQLPADAVQRYNELQDRIAAALNDPNTPTELIRPLAAAGYSLFSYANQAGLTGVKLPAAVLYSLSGGVRPPRKP